MTDHLIQETAERVWPGDWLVGNWFGYTQLWRRIIDNEIISIRLCISYMDGMWCTEFHVNGYTRAHTRTLDLEAAITDARNRTQASACVFAQSSGVTMTVRNDEERA